jgi:hypothetical protein
MQHGQRFGPTRDGSQHHPPGGSWPRPAVTFDYLAVATLARVGERLIRGAGRQRRGSDTEPRIPLAESGLPIPIEPAHSEEDVDPCRVDVPISPTALVVAWFT